LGSALVIWGLAFILGLTCGIEGAYFNRSVGAPAYAGVFSAEAEVGAVALGAHVAGSLREEKVVER